MRNQSLHSQKKGTLTPTSFQITEEVGIVPSPEVLEKYKQIDPKFVEMYIETAKKMIDARIENETILVKSTGNMVLKSFMYAFGSITMLCGLGAYGFYLGYPVATASMVSACVGSLAVAFILKKK